MSQDAIVQTKTKRSEIIATDPDWIVAERSVTPFPVTTDADLWDGVAPFEHHERLFDPVPAYPPIDWRERAALFPARDQRPCESCTAHAIASVMSDLQAVRAWPSRGPLSPGFIHACVGAADCATTVRPDFLLTRLVAQAVPAATAKDHPFDPADCKAALASGRVRVAGPFERAWGAIEAQRTLQRGPILAIMDAYADFWEWYGGGVYAPTGAGPSRQHAVAVVGFGPGHWIIKNSLGSGWGMLGYAKVQAETCRLLTEGGFPGYVFDIAPA